MQIHETPLRTIEHVLSLGAGAGWWLPSKAGSVEGFHGIYLFHF